jgi:hypothetical protein
VTSVSFGILSRWPNHFSLWDLINLIIFFRLISSSRNKNDLHPSLSILEKFKKGPGISGIKAYNHLPQYLKTLDHNSSSFRTSLKRFMHQHAFYSIEEYYE